MQESKETDVLCKKKKVKTFEISVKNIFSYAQTISWVWIIDFALLIKICQNPQNICFSTVNIVRFLSFCMKADWSPSCWIKLTFYFYFKIQLNFFVPIFWHVAVQTSNWIIINAFSKQSFWNNINNWMGIKTLKKNPIHWLIDKIIDGLGDD